MGTKYSGRITIPGLACLFFLSALCWGAEPGSGVPPDFPFLTPPEESTIKESTITEESAISKEDTISLDLRGIDITELFKILSKKLNKNIIPSKNVMGRINLFLDNVRYEDVLDIIMVSQNLAYEKKGENVIIVMTGAEYESLYGEKFNEKREIMTLKLKYAQPKTISSALNNLKSNVGNIVIDEATGTMILIDIPEKLKVMKGIFDDLDRPTTTEIFELQYAKAEDIQDDITSLVAEGAGSVLTDERTNSLIVTDLPGNMNKIRQTIKLLDQETKQVLIESEIVEITLSDEFNYGINWQKIMNDPSFWGTVLTGTFPVLGTTTTTSTTLASTYQRIALGTLDEHKFTIVMNLLKSLGDVKVLSSPRLAVTNNEEASIHVGTRRPIISGTRSQSGDSVITSDTVEYVDLGIKLVVVPTINRDGFITMKIKPEITSSTSNVTTGTSTDTRSVIPIVTTSEAETTVKIKDGAMIMIAGLKKNDQRRTVEGVPFLCEIPILGTLFGNRDTSRITTEIIIFLTPHIIKGEDMMAWDLEKLKEYPRYKWPENRGYFEPKFKASSLRKSKK